MARIVLTAWLFLFAGVVAAAPLHDQSLSLRIAIVDAVSREPMAGASLEAVIEGVKTVFTTDAMGNASLTLSDRLRDPLSVLVLKAGHAPKRVYWTPSARNPLPEEATIAIEPGSSIGGRVVDEQGAPIADVTVTLHLAVDRGTRIEPIDTQTTVAEGAWRCDRIPRPTTRSQSPSRIPISRAASSPQPRTSRRLTPKAVGR